jgi:hypothetical protein
LSAPYPGTGSSADALTAAEFQNELKASARLDRALVIADPLAAAVAQIQQHPSFAQSRLLTRILIALAHGEGSFRRAELSTLDLPSRGLAVALVKEHTEGTSPREAWVKAVDAANAAQLAAEA